MSNVLTIPGIQPAVNPMKPNAVLVEYLHGLVAQAEAGEIVGMAASFMHGDGLASWSQVGQVGSFSMLGALRKVEHELIKTVDAPYE